MGDVTLVVPLAAFPIGRGRQRDDPHHPRVEVFGYPLDRAALAGAVAAFEDYHDARAGMPHPLLQFDEFCLKPEQFSRINLSGDLMR
jgi:hypothetical protein